MGLLGCGLRVRVWDRVNGLLVQGWSYKILLRVMVKDLGLELGLGLGLPMFRSKPIVPRVGDRSDDYVPKSKRTII